MSELDELLKQAKQPKKQEAKVKTTKSPLWQELLPKLGRIEQEKKNGKTYKKMADEMGVAEVTFSRSLKRAKAEADTLTNEPTSEDLKSEQESSSVNFVPQLPEPEVSFLGEIEELELVPDPDASSPDESAAYSVETTQTVINVTERLDELVNELKNINSSLIDSVSEVAAEAAAAEILKIKVASAEAATQAQKYGEDAKKYVDKMTAQTISVLVKKSADVIEHKIAEATADINKQKAKYSPVRWASATVISCLLLVGGGYYAGIENYLANNDYQVAKANEAKWGEFVTQWQKASEAEKKVIETMMKRGR